MRDKVIWLLHFRCRWVVRTGVARDLARTCESDVVVNPGFDVFDQNYRSMRWIDGVCER